MNRSYQQLRAIFASLSKRKGIKPGRARLKSVYIGRQRIAESIKNQLPMSTMYPDDLVRLLKERSMRRASMGKGMKNITGSWTKAGDNVHPNARYRNDATWQMGSVGFSVME